VYTDDTFKSGFNIVIQLTSQQVAAYIEDYYILNNHWFSKNIRAFKQSIKTSKLPIFNTCTIQKYNMGTYN